MSATKDELRAIRALADDGEVGAARERVLILISKIESDQGSDCVDLIGPLYLLANVESKHHPWNQLSLGTRWALERALTLATHAQTSGVTAERIRETLAASLRANGEAAAAVEHMALVVAEKRKRGLKGIFLAHAILGLAEIHLDAGNFEEAITEYDRGAAEDGVSAEPLTIFAIAFGRGRAYLGMGRLTEARRDLGEALRIFVDRFGSEGRRSDELREWLRKAGSSAEGAG